MIKKFKKLTLFQLLVLTIIVVVITGIWQWKIGNLTEIEGRGFPIFYYIENVYSDVSVIQLDENFKFVSSDYNPKKYSGIKIIGFAADIIFWFLIIFVVQKLLIRFKK